MKRDTPITVEWLESHNFIKHTGMTPVGCGEMYYYKLGKNEIININTTGGSLGIIKMCVYQGHKNQVEITKPYQDIENSKFNCFYVEELHYLLELSNNDTLIEYFN